MGKKFYDGGVWSRVDAKTLEGKTLDDIKSELTKDDVGLSEVINVKQAAASRKIKVGKGLIGGGTLEADVNVSMGIPSTLGIDSINEITEESHSHKIDFPVTSVNGETGDIVLPEYVTMDDIRHVIDPDWVGQDVGPDAQVKFVKVSADEFDIQGFKITGDKESGTLQFRKDDEEE